MKKWLSLSYIYMTEESDDTENPDGFVLHPLPWRSQSELEYNALPGLC